MRLRYLYLPDYGPLKNVAVVFQKNPHIENRQGAINFVVGLNGSGKSSLLRALFDVFSSLFREELPKFPVTMAYDVQKPEGVRLVLFHRPRGPASEAFFESLLEFETNHDAEEWQAFIEAQKATSRDDPLANLNPYYSFGDSLKGNRHLQFFLPDRVLAYTSGDLDPWRSMTYLSTPMDELPDAGSEIDRTSERPYGWTSSDEQMTAKLPRSSIAPKHSTQLADLGDDDDKDDDWDDKPDISNDFCYLLSPGDTRLAAAAVGIWQASKELHQYGDEAQLATLRKTLIHQLDGQQSAEGARRLLNELDWLLPTHIAFRFSRHIDSIYHPDHARLYWLIALSENVVAQPLGETLAVVSLGHAPDVRPEDLTGNEELILPLKEAGESMRNARSGAEALCALLSGGKPADKSLWSIFETLRSWRSIGLLIDVQLTIKRIRKVENVYHKLDDRILSYSSFSDGEQMLLGRMAFLLLLHKQDNSLLLLDEPETHFNDTWKRQIIDMVDDSILKDTSAQVLVSTHTSLALTDVFSCEITRLVKDRGTTRAERVAHPTFGADPGRILLHIFGAPDVIGARAAEFLRSKLDPAKWPPEDREKLRSLIDEIGSGWPRAKLMDILDILEGSDAPQS